MIEGQNIAIGRTSDLPVGEAARSGGAIYEDIVYILGWLCAVG